jgi:mannosyltransferase OCH1-like enzyme
MIPKIIHYCWFGRNPLPELAEVCIESWKKYLPDYEIIEWNESNFDVTQNNYISQAYSRGKYAFVSDFARYKILHEHGGLYFDTDVEIIKPLDDIIAEGSFMAIETPGNVASGLGMGTIAKLPLLKPLIEQYEYLDFIQKNGQLNQTTIVDYTSSLLVENGLKNEDVFQHIAGINIYPKAFFNPMIYDTKEIVISEDTRSIHHYAGSWCDEPSFTLRLKHFLARLIGKKFFHIIQSFTHRNDKYRKK